MTQQSIAAIREAANVLREQVGYAIEETGGWRIDNIRVFSDQVLRLLDAAEKDTAYWKAAGWVDEKDGDKWRHAGYRCSE